MTSNGFRQCTEYFLGEGEPDEIVKHKLPYQYIIQCIGIRLRGRFVLFHRFLQGYASANKPGFPQSR